VKTYGVVFAWEAEGDLAELYDYIAEHGSPTVAARYTEAIIEYCEGLASKSRYSR
jgi:toxin ParE1/3/4